MDGWGTVAAWGAVVISIAALVTSIIALVREHRRDKERKANEAKTQADRVSAWLHQYKPEIGFTNYAVWYRNASGLPVYDIDLKVLSQRDGTVFWQRKLKLLEPNDSPEEIKIESPSADVEIGTTISKEIVEKDGKWSGVELEYRDSAGTRWRRDSFGVLAKLPDSTTA